MPPAIIEKISYDAATRVLSIWLVTNGKRYDYQEVPLETYGAFRAAFSKGRFFNRYIRPHFAVTQGDAGNADALPEA